jgi:hypothetical protein
MNSSYNIVRNDHASVSNSRRMPTIIVYTVASTLRGHLTQTSLAETGVSMARSALILKLSKPSLP